MLPTSTLVVIPVYNEVDSVPEILAELRKCYPGHILFIDDGSSDGSTCVLKCHESPSISVIHHATNKGYGRSLITGFQFAIDRGIEAVVTMDADRQHEPCLVPEFFKQLDGVDVVSGSRYLKDFSGDDVAPADRQKINQTITKEINSITGYNLTDTFCGFKAYRVEALKILKLDETGYAMPLQFWIQAAHFQLRVKEIAVPRIYSDPSRQFAGPIKDPEIRLAHYRDVISKEVARWKKV